MSYYSGTDTATRNLGCLVALVPVVAIACVLLMIVAVLS